MPHRMPSVAFAVVCGLIAAMHGRSIRAAEIPTAQREAIEGIIHDYLLKNPDVLIEALRSAEDKLNREADAKATTVLNDREKEIFDDPATPVGGNPRGDVTIVEFFDYRCPYCKQVLPVLQTLLKEDHQLRFVYKEMPVLGPVSVVAAHAALAARRQGKYEAFHAAMMATKGQITDDTVYKVAGSVGLDVDRLKQDMTAPEIEQELKANLALADALNIRGTPGFIVGKKIVPGALDLDALKNMVAEARKGSG
jgi:protein-disulfide isomerase